MGPDLAAERTPDAPAARLRDAVWLSGAAACPHARKLASGAAPRRDLADAVHALAAVHGHRPGLIEAAHDAGPDPWLADAAEHFAHERARLAGLLAASGPLPSTLGQAATEAALANQRRALAVIGGSARRGCALGAAAALMLDWLFVDRILWVASDAFAFSAQPMRFEREAGLDAAIARSVAGGGSERALLFGAEQLLTQQRGFWSLLDARAAARDA